MNISLQEVGGIPALSCCHPDSFDGVLTELEPEIEGVNLLFYPAQVIANPPQVTPPAEHALISVDKSLSDMLHRSKGRSADRGAPSAARLQRRSLLLAIQPAGLESGFPSKLYRQ